MSHSLYSTKPLYISVDRLYYNTIEAVLHYNTRDFTIIIHLILPTHYALKIIYYCKSIYICNYINIYTCINIDYR